MTEEMRELCRRYGWSYTERCDIAFDGYCYTHRTWDMAECALAEMNRREKEADK